MCVGYDPLSVKFFFARTPQNTVCRPLDLAAVSLPGNPHGYEESAFI